MSGYTDQGYPSVFHAPGSIIHLSSLSPMTGVRPIVESLNPDNVFLGPTVFTEPYTYTDRSRVAVGSTGDPGLATLASLALSAATMGTMTPFAAGLLEVAQTSSQALIASAVLSSLASQTAQSLVMNDGDVSASLRQVASVDTLRSLAAAGITAGVMPHAMSRFKVPVDPSSFLDYAHQSVVRGAVSFGVNTVVLGQDFEQALKTTTRGIAVNTFGGYVARHIGQGHSQERIGTIEQLFFHTGLGALEGLILDPQDPLRGAKAGGAGAFGTELTATLLGSHPREEALRRVSEGRAAGLSDTEIFALQESDLAQRMAWSEFGAGLFAYTLGQDVSIAATTGGIALANNMQASHEEALRKALAAQPNTIEQESLRQTEEEQELFDEEEYPQDPLSASSSYLPSASSSAFPSTSSSDLFRGSTRGSLEEDPELSLLFSSNNSSFVGETTEDQITRFFLQPPSPSFFRPPTPPLEDTWGRGVLKEAERSHTIVRVPMELARNASEGIGHGLSRVRQEQQQAEQWADRFAQDPTLDTWSTPDMARFMAFQALDQTSVIRGAQMLQTIGIATEYGKSYMRRTLRFTGVSAPIAQDIVDGIEIGTIVGSLGANAGVKATRYVGHATAQATRHLTQKGAQLLGNTQKTTHAWVNKASDVTRKAHHTLSKARGSAQVYLEYDLPNALERAFAPGGYTKAERELLQYGDMFEPSRRDFWGPSSRDFLPHPTRTAQLTRTSRGPHIAPAPSYAVPSDTVLSGESPFLFPDLPISTRPTPVPLWDVRGNTSSHVSSMFREASSSRSVAPPWKQAPLFPQEPSYVVQGLEMDITLMGEYRLVRGHHVHAKKAFEGHVNYDPQKGFSISRKYMETFDIDHDTITQAQRRLFRELAGSNRPNTLKEHTRIAVEALIEGGASYEQARNIVAQSLWDLKMKGIKNPKNIPWAK